MIVTARCPRQVTAARWRMKVADKQYVWRTYDVRRTTHFIIIIIVIIIIIIIIIITDKQTCVEQLQLSVHARKI